MDDAAHDDAGRDVPTEQPSEPPADHPVDHRGPWTEAEYRALTEPGGAPDLEKALGDARVELVDGALVIGPGPTAEDDRVVAHTRAVLGDALPDGLCVVGPVPVRMGRECVLVPDLVVMRTPEPAPDAVVDGQDVLMVVEVVGAEHGAVDRTFKPLVYARARVPYLLLVDRQARYAAASMVINGRYHEYARAADALELEEPFRLRLPLPET